MLVNQNLQRLLDSTAKLKALIVNPGKARFVFRFNHANCYRKIIAYQIHVKLNSYPAEQREFLQEFHEIEFSWVKEKTTQEPMD